MSHSADHSTDRLTDHSALAEPLPLAHRKRVATRQRIAASAARLVAENGLAAATVDRIADTAEVGRATFFRYFNTKEDAVAEGINEQWLGRSTRALSRNLATLTRSSPALEAWTLHIYLRYEAAIAALLAPRMADLIVDDPRPRLLGALAMATVRVALDDWLAHGGSLPERVHRGLTSIRVD